jgi:hypothetical protein
MKKSVITLAFAGLALTGCTSQIAGSATPADPTVFVLTGSFVLYDYDLTKSCIGSGGYDDIYPGQSITVYDESAHVVGVGELGSGTHSAGSCEYPVKVEDLPLGSKFYQVEVSHRGKVMLTADEAQAGEFGAHLG